MPSPIYPFGPGDWESWHSVFARSWITQLISRFHPTGSYKQFTEEMRFELAAEKNIINSFVQSTRLNKEIVEAREARERAAASKRRPWRRKRSKNVWLIKQDASKSRRKYLRFIRLGRTMDWFRPRRLGAHNRGYPIPETSPYDEVLAGLGLAQTRLRRRAHMSKKDSFGGFAPTGRFRRGSPRGYPQSRWQPMQGKRGVIRPMFQKSVEDLLDF